jgi:hypothetical protein
MKGQCDIDESIVLGPAMVALEDIFQQRSRDAYDLAGEIDKLVTMTYVCILHSYCTLIHFPIGNYR